MDSILMGFAGLIKSQAIMRPTANQGYAHPVLHQHVMANSDAINDRSVIEDHGVDSAVKAGSG